MAKRISEKVREEIQRLYDDGNGMAPAKITLQTGVKYPTVYAQTRRIKKIRENGFKSYTEYQKHLARKNGFKSPYEYHKHLARKRVNPETGEPFKSYSEYNKHLARKRSEKEDSIEFGNLVRTRLRDLDRTQSWLSEQVKVSGATISFYANGKLIPQGENLNRLLLTLEIKDLPKGLENLVQ